VNKVATKAELRLSLVEAAAWIPPNVLASLYKTSANRISNEQVLVITSSRFRTQGANTKDALDRLQRLIDEARTASLPPKAPTAAKKKRIKGLARKDDRVRLAKKSRVADKKKSRSKKFGMDD